MKQVFKAKVAKVLLISLLITQNGVLQTPGAVMFQMPVKEQILEEEDTDKASAEVNDTEENYSSNQQELTLIATPSNVQPPKDDTAVDSEDDKLIQEKPVSSRPEIADMDVATPLNARKLMSNAEAEVWDGISEQEVLPVNGIYSIQYPSELAWVMKVTNDGTETFTGKTIYIDNDLDMGGHEWGGIGSYANPFRGNVAGNGHTISNIKQENRTETIGLFGVTEAQDNSFITDLIIDSAEFSGEASCSGLLVGHIQLKTGSILKIANIEISGSLNVSGCYFGGGLAGRVYAPSSAGATVNIKNVKTMGDITDDVYSLNGSIANIGGLVGYYDNPTGKVEINNSSTNVNIDVTAQNKAGIYTAGIFGGCNGKQIEFNKVYATGTLIGRAGESCAGGGMIGNCETDSLRIRNSYMTSTMDIGGSNGVVGGGGLVGILKCRGSYKDSFFTNCHVAGHIGSSHYAAFILQNDSSTETVEVNNCYYNRNSMGLKNDGDKITHLGFFSTIRLNCPNGYGISDSEMGEESSFSGWDFDNVWIMQGNGYPELREEIDIPIIDDSNIVRFIRWDEKNKTAYFSNTEMGYHASKETDMSFLDSLNSFLGNYVWVEYHSQNVGEFLSITLLEEKFGLIMSSDSNVIKIDGKDYEMRTELGELVDTIKDYYLNRYVKYYISNDVIYDIQVPDEKKGIWKSWNSATYELTIEDLITGEEKVYLSHLVDLSVLANITAWLDKEITYYVLDGIIYQIITEEQEINKIGKLKSYDSSTGKLQFEDNTEYDLSPNIETNIDSLIGKWTSFVLNTSADGITQIVVIKNLEPKVKMEVELSASEIICKDGKYSIDGELYKDKNKFEIPFVITICNTLDISEDDLKRYQEQLKAEKSFDIKIQSLDMELLDNFYFEWVQGKKFEEGKILKFGDTWVIEGLLKLNSDYLSDSGSKIVMCTANSTSGIIVAKTKIYISNGMEEKEPVKSERSKEYNNAVKEVQDELKKLTENAQIVLDSSLKQYATERQLESIKEILLLWSTMVSDAALVDNTSFRIGMDKTLGVENRVTADKLKAEITIQTSNSKGTRNIKFTLDSNVYGFGGTEIGTLATIPWKVEGENVSGQCMFIKVGNLSSLKEKLQKCAKTAIQDAYNKAWGELINTAVSTTFVDGLVLDIVKNHCGSIAKGVFNLIWDGSSALINPPKWKSLSTGDIRKYLKDLLLYLNTKVNIDWKDDVALLTEWTERIDTVYEQWKGTLTESKRDKSIKAVDLENLDEVYAKIFAYKNPDRLQLIHSETGTYISGKALKEGVIPDGTVPKLEVKILTEGQEYDEAINYAQNSWFKKKPDVVVDISIKDVKGNCLQPNVGILGLDKLELHLSLGSQYAERKVTIYHATHDEAGFIKWKDHSVTADINGNVKIKVSSLSPFMIMLENELKSSNTNEDSYSSGDDTYVLYSDFGKKQGMIPLTQGFWILDENGWKFLNPEGFAYMDTWIYVKNLWYWIGKDGYMKEGWVSINNIWYYLMPVSGEMKTGWLYDGTNWYYLDETGAMKTGWILVASKWYFLDSSGIMLHDTTTPDGYIVGSDGEWKINH